MEITRNNIKDGLASPYYFDAKDNSDGESTMLNPRYGGQWGYSAEIGKTMPDGSHQAQWISSQAYVPRDVIALIMQYPKFFDLMPNPTGWKEAFKSIMEKHCEVISGIESAITVETERNMLGASNSLFIDEPTGVRIKESSITKSFTEKIGRPIGKMMASIIIYGIGDPFTQLVMVGEFSAEAREYIRKTPWLADMYSYTALYIEPDVTGLRAENAYIHFGAYPTTDGAPPSGMDKANAKAITKLEIPIAGSTLSSSVIIKFAQKELDRLTVRFIRPIDVMPFDNADAGVDNLKNTYGFNSTNA